MFRKIEELKYPAKGQQICLSDDSKLFAVKQRKKIDIFSFVNLKKPQYSIDIKSKRCVFTPDSLSLLVIGQDCSLIIYSIETESIIKKIENSHFISSLCYSNSGMLALGLRFKIKIFNSQLEEIEEIHHNESGLVQQVMFSQKNDKLYALSEDRFIAYDTTEYEVCNEKEMELKEFPSLSQNNKGDLLAFRDTKEIFIEDQQEFEFHIEKKDFDNNFLQPIFFDSQILLFIENRPNGFSVFNLKSFEGQHEFKRKFRFDKTILSHYLTQDKKHYILEFERGIEVFQVLEQFIQGNPIEVLFKFQQDLFFLCPILNNYKQILANINSNVIFLSQIYNIKNFWLNKEDKNTKKVTKKKINEKEIEEDEIFLPFKLEVQSLRLENLKNMFEVLQEYKENQDKLKLIHFTELSNKEKGLLASFRQIEKYDKEHKEQIDFIQKKTQCIIKQIDIRYQEMCEQRKNTTKEQKMDLVSQNAQQLFDKIKDSITEEEIRSTNLDPKINFCEL